MIIYNPKAIFVKKCFPFEVGIGDGISLCEAIQEDLGNNRKDYNTNQNVTWTVNVKPTHLNPWTMTNINFLKWGQGIQCDHQYGTALLATFINFYTVLKISLTNHGNL